MIKSRPVLACHLVLLVSLAATGCGGPATVADSASKPNTGALEEVGELYRSVGAVKKKPPTSMKDLERSRDVFLLGYRAIEQGDVIVYWGVSVLSGDQTTDEILAYTAEVPTKGGPVLLKNGTVKTMTADEFKAAPKPAGPTSSKSKVG
jgi:hypothetical protein